ncbi:MAG TPA: recombinase family protein, partial [Actinophytocola sp.]|uniref:recombinase family protein n=1 Tax=Actinophytocola sp. TaxID=1872138 RepID=UPI002E07C48C|nr:recombinase family protein [Actinophytocola sp.]
MSRGRGARRVARPDPSVRDATSPKEEALWEQAAGPLRVAIYIRISTDEEHQPFSLEAQDKRLHAYAGTQPGWEVVAVFRDEASGATLERPDLQRALATARAGRFDVLLVYRVDRLARSLRGLVHILDELDDAGAVFRSATEPFDTATPVGRMLVQMLGVFAQFERETIIDRVINGMERKAARGQWCGGYRPYGYEPDPATDILRPVADESPLVPLIFDMYVTGRHGAKALAGELNQRGHRTRYGKPWSAQSVLTVLRNRAYLGEVYFRGTWYRAEHHHPPLVEPDVFEQAQQIMIARGDDRSRRAASSSDYLLAGRVFCDRCGKRYLGAAAHGRTARYRYYTCFSANRYGKHACDADRLPADKLEHLVLDALITTFERTDLVNAAATDAASRFHAVHDQHRAELDTVCRELASAEAKIDRYLAAFEAGDLPQARCGDRIQALADTTAKLRRRRDELEALLADDTPSAPTEEDLATLTAGVRDAVATGEPARIKPVIERLVHEVRIRGRNHIHATFRIPPTPPTLNPQSTVREMVGSVHWTARYSNHNSAGERLERLHCAVSELREAPQSADAVPIPPVAECEP